MLVNFVYFLQYVIKRLAINDAAVRKSAVAETESLCQLKHPNIVQYKECFIQSDEFSIVMEYYEGGDMDAKLKKHDSDKVPVPERQIVQWTLELCLALQVCMLQ